MHGRNFTEREKSHLGESAIDNDQIRERMLDSVQSRDSITSCPAFYFLPGANSGSEQCSEPVTEKYRGTRRVFRRNAVIDGREATNRNSPHRIISREEMTCSNKIPTKENKNRKVTLQMD